MLGKWAYFTYTLTRLSRRLQRPLTASPGQGACKTLGRRDTQARPCIEFKLGARRRGPSRAACQSSGRRKEPTLLARVWGLAGEKGGAGLRLRDDHGLSR